MAINNGFRIKEARTAAGLSQEALAKATPGVTVKDISQAERGIKELTPEKLAAIAETLGVMPESLTSNENENEPAAETRPSLTDSEVELLELYRTADAGKQKMVLFILKGEMPDPAMITMLPELIKAIDPAALLAAGKDFLFAANIGELLGYANSLVDFKKLGESIGQLKYFLNNRKQPGAPDAAADPAGDTEDAPAGVADAPVSDAAAGNCVPAIGKEISSSLLTFTYLYSSSIYILLLSFYFWLWRTDIKPE